MSPRSAHHASLPPVAGLWDHVPAMRDQLHRLSSPPRVRRLASSPFPMWVFDRRTGAVTESNEAAVHVYGRSHEQLRRCSVADLIAPQGLDAHPALRGAHASVVWTPPLRHVLGHGKVLWAELGLIDADGPQTGWTMAIVNVRAHLSSGDDGGGSAP